MAHDTREGSSMTTRSCNPIASLQKHTVEIQTSEPSQLLLHQNVDHLCECRLERSAADQKPIDVRLGDQRFAIVWRSAAAVLYADFVRGCVAALGANVVPDICLGILRLFRCRHLACADCPNWLICNHELVPVLDQWKNLFEHPLIYGVCNAAFALYKGFSDCTNHTETSCLALHHLRNDIVVRLTIQDATLGVANESPTKAALSDHTRRPLACECALGHFRNVL